MIQRSRAQIEVLALVVELSDPLDPAGSWFESEMDADLRVALPNTVDVLNRLRDRAGETALRACSLVEDSEEGSLVLSERWTRHTGDPLIVMRTSAESAPFDLMTNRGLMFGNESVIEAALHDYRIVEMLERSSNRLFLASAMDSVIGLREAGLPGTPWAGLVEPNWERLHDLERLTGGNCRPLLIEESTAPGIEISDNETQATSTTSLPQEEVFPGEDSLPSLVIGECNPVPEAEASSAATEELQDAMMVMEPPAGSPATVGLIFSAWSPAGRSVVPVEELHSIMGVLSSAEEHLGLDFSAVALWAPKQYEERRIEFCQQMRDGCAAARAILSSVHDSSYAVSTDVCDRIGPPRMPCNIVEARRALLHALTGHGKGAEESRRALQEYVEVIERDFLRPVMVEAAAAPNPAKSGMLAQWAEELRLVLTLAPSLQDDVTRAFYERNAKHAESMIARMRLFSQLMDRAFRHGAGLCK